MVPGIIDQNKSYKDAGFDLARVQKHHRPPAAAEELQQNPLQPAAWNYRVIMGPIQAGLDPACHTEPRSLISFFPTREPRSAASRPCLLQFSPPRPRINSEPSHLQEDCKPPLEVNPFSQATLQKIGKDKETERRSRKVRERSASAPTTSSPALALIPCGKDWGLIVGRPGR